VSPREGGLPRLLVLASTYPRWAGDTEPGFVHELAKRLTNDFDVTVLAPSAPGAARREEMEGVHVHRYRYAPRSLQTLVNDGGMLTNLKRKPWKWLLVPGFLLGMLWSTWSLTRQWRPSVIHAHWLVPQGFAVALLAALWPRTPRFVITSHGADLFSLRGAIMRLAKQFVARRAAAMTVVSSAMLSEAETLGLTKSAIHVEPMGVDLARFVPTPEMERAHDEILFVGRLVEKKGLSHLIVAMPHVLRSRPHARLVVVGDGPERSKCEQIARDLGVIERVLFVGAVAQAELATYYRRASLFVAPFVRAVNGDQEGLGLVLVEAAGCGCRIVAGDVPAIRDVISDGAYFRIADPTDELSFSKEIVRFLSSPIGAGEMPVIAESVSHFDWKRRAAAYSRLLSSQMEK